jgi:class 3 adenylate cyclase
MTPFELNLRHALDIERQRFGNKWLFPWHNINIANHRVEVEDFQGGKFAVGGIVFQGQIRDLYWQAISRYLIGEAHETFRKWAEETKAYPGQVRRLSLNGTNTLVKGFVAGIIKRAVDTDRALRGRGFPEKVAVYDPRRELSNANDEISRLTDSYRALIENDAPAPQNSTTERRLAAIFNADVVGYSRLMEFDEVGILAALNSYQKDFLEPMVARNNGRIVKLMGDGVLVEFASAVNAVQCGVDLQAAMNASVADLTKDRRLVLRIGVALGEVIAQGPDIYGDAVNIAARLQAMADPGSVVVSETVYDHVRVKIQVAFDDLGEQSLKNITRPIRIYRVRSMSKPTGAEARAVT